MSTFEGKTILEVAQESGIDIPTLCYLPELPPIGSCFMGCDKANICKLRSVAADLEAGIPQLRVRKRYYPIEDISPYITRDLTKCILCRRCV